MDVRMIGVKMPKPIRIEMKARNNAVLTRMEELGITSVLELCRRGKMWGSRGLVYKLVNLQESPITTDSTPENPSWRPLALKIAKALGSSVMEMFPDEIWYAKVEPGAKFHLEVSLDEVRRIAGRVPPQLVAPGSIDEEENKLMVHSVLDMMLRTLTPREEKILRYRFGLDDGFEKSLEEVGGLFAITPSRVRQIEDRALRKMRHPQRTKRIVEAGLNKYLNH